MRRRSPAPIVTVSLLLAAAAAGTVLAQSGGAASGGASGASASPPIPAPGSAFRPGRSPTQPVDEAYTRKIREYTTEPFFFSPLVAFLPAPKTVPTPPRVLGATPGPP